MLRSTRINTNKARGVAFPKYQTRKSLISNPPSSIQFTKIPKKKFKKLLTDNNIFNNLAESSNKYNNQKEKSDSYLPKVVKNQAVCIKLTRLHLAHTDSIKCNLSMKAEKSSKTKEKEIFNKKKQRVKTPESSKKSKISNQLNSTKKTMRNRSALTKYSNSISSANMSSKRMNTLSKTSLKTEFNTPAKTSRLTRASLLPSNQNSEKFNSDNSSNTSTSTTDILKTREPTRKSFYRESTKRKGNTNYNFDFNDYQSDSSEDNKDKTISEEDCESESETESEDEEKHKARKEKHKRGAEDSESDDIVNSEDKKKYKSRKKKQKRDVKDSESDYIKSCSNGQKKYFSKDGETKNVKLPKISKTHFKTPKEASKQIDTSQNGENDELKNGKYYFPVRRVNDAILLINQNELNSLIQELGLSKNKTELLTTWLKEKNLLKKRTRATLSKARDKSYREYFADDSE